MKKKFGEMTVMQKVITIAGGILVLAASGLGGAKVAQNYKNKKNNGNNDQQSV